MYIIIYSYKYDMGRFYPLIYTNGRLIQFDTYDIAVSSAVEYEKQQNVVCYVINMKEYFKE